MEGGATRLSPGQSANGTMVLRRHGLAPLDDARAQTASGRGRPEVAIVSLIAIVAERCPEEMIAALCLAGMIHARNRPKPRMPRFGTEQMRYMRSRPWRSRGPWFENRAGARRRGRRADELVFADSDELLDSAAPAEVDDVEAEDVLLAGAPAWPILERMPTAWVAHDRASLLAMNGPDHDPARQSIDQLAEAV